MTMKIVITKACRIQELDDTNDKGVIIKRGVGAVGESVNIDKKPATDLINMKKAALPDSDEAKLAIKQAKAAKDAEKETDKGDGK